MPQYEKIVVITAKTTLEELIERHNTREQVRFYLSHHGASFEEYQGAHDAYVVALGILKSSIPRGVRGQFVDRSYLPTFTFGPADLVVTLGRDGLVVNTARYLAQQPLVAFNPDPSRIDGILVPFPVTRAPDALQSVAAGRFRTEQISMARAELNDGQSLHAVNDFFIGQQTHVSARYRLAFRGVEEDQSSSGIIVSTGAGSTGWFRSIVTGAAGFVQGFAASVGSQLDRDATDELEEAKGEYRFDRQAESLRFSVREPFVSKSSSARLVFGEIGKEDELVINSQMPPNGVIFSDGVEADYLQFNAGSIARIRVAERSLHLVTAME